VNRIAHWMRGVIGIGPPDWVLVLQAAEAWGQTPWVIETECSEEWWTRYLTYRAAQSRAQEMASK